MKKIREITLILLSKKIFHILPDKMYLKIKYFLRTNEKLNLNNPQTFNEKLQWLKINDRKSIYTVMADKYEAKGYISKKVGKEYIIPTIGIYEKFDDIDFDKLPKSFAIKCTHDSGGVIVCEDKSQLNLKFAKTKIKKSLKNKYFYLSREWVYKNIKPRIIVEEYIGSNLIDYRFYCFNGKPQYIYVYTNESQTDNSKPEPAHCNIFDTNWKTAKFSQKCTPSKEKIAKPKNYDEMIKISKKLSQNIPFLRVDFYEVNSKLYVGELTFYPGSGMSKFYPNEADLTLGKMLDITMIGNKNEK